MSELLNFLLFALIGYFVFRLLVAIAALIWLKNNKEELQQEIEKTVKENVIMMRLETNEDGVFAYRLNSGEFLAHGITYDMMIENLLARFPGKTALVPKDQADLARGAQS